MPPCSPCTTVVAAMLYARAPLRANLSPSEQITKPIASGQKWWTSEANNLTQNLALLLTHSRETPMVSMTKERRTRIPAQLSSIPAGRPVWVSSGPQDLQEGSSYQGTSAEASGRPTCLPTPCPLGCLPVGSPGRSFRATTKQKDCWGSSHPARRSEGKRRRIEGNRRQVIRAVPGGGPYVLQDCPGATLFLVLPSCGAGASSTPMPPVVVAWPLSCHEGVWMSCCHRHGSTAQTLPQPPQGLPVASIGAGHALPGAALHRDPGGRERPPMACSIQHVCVAVLALGEQSCKGAVQGSTLRAPKGRCRGS